MALAALVSAVTVTAIAGLRSPDALATA